jgi:hypothetical protein
MNWNEISRLLEGVYASAIGLPLTLLKVLVVSVWYDESKRFGAEPCFIAVAVFSMCQAVPELRSI